MKSATLIAVLVRLTSAMAAVAPLVVFGSLYMVAVEPQRAAARTAQQQLEGASARAFGGRRTLFKYRRSVSLIRVRPIRIAPGKSPRRSKRS